MGLEKKLKSVKMVVLDVDGVLTDGRVWVLSSGEEMLGFDIKDGMGVSMLREAGIEVAILTGRKSGAVVHRAKALGIRNLRLGEKRKLKALKEMAKKAGCGLEEIAYVGDDIADLEPMKAAGLAAAVADAVPEILEIADIKLKKPGGHGAVRELAEKVLKGRKKKK